MTPLFVKAYLPKRFIPIAVVLLVIAGNAGAQILQEQMEGELPDPVIDGISWEQLEVEHRPGAVEVPEWYGRIDGRAVLKQRRYETHRERSPEAEAPVRETVEVIIELDGPQVPAELTELGFVTHLQLDEYVIGRLPVARLTEASTVSGVAYLEAAPEMEMLHDESMGDIRATRAHSGLTVERPYKGEDVIVGVIDTGIDFTHPDFQTEEGTRLEYLIDYQEHEFGSGVIEPEIWSRDDIDDNPDQVTQRDRDGHGTHVTGTAAGGGQALESMTGVAPESDIITVNAQSSHVETDETTFPFVNMIHGTMRVFEKAQELNKPAVVNISLGAGGGPRDGSTGLDQIFSDLAENEGNIIVASAGNSGFFTTHAGADLTPRSRYIAPILIMEDEDEETFTVDFEAWYDQNAVSEIMLAGVKEGDSGAEIVGSTPWLPPGATLDEEVAIEDDGETLGYVDIVQSAHVQSGDEYYENIANEDSHFSGEIYRNDSGTDLSDTQWVLVVNASIQGGRFDFFINNTGTGPTTGGLVYPRKFRSVNTEQMVGDHNMSMTSPATAGSVISVASYVNRESWPNRAFENEVYFPVPVGPLNPDNTKDPSAGTRSYFSSVGPLRNGKLAPDISAPGQYIFSAKAAGINYGQWEDHLSHPDGPYRISSGTSMASPHVAGAIALMLENDPGLDVEDIRQIFAETARSDHHTGGVPNYEFGYGKLDVAAALQLLEEGHPARMAEMLQDPEQVQLSNYPNPFNPVTTVEFALPEDRSVDLRVYNSLGRQVKHLVEDRQMGAGTHEITFDGSELSSGVYIIRMEAGGRNLTRQVTLIK